MGAHPHFPATQDMILKYLSVSARYETCQQYIKHLEWAHNFLRLECTWQNSIYDQAMRGMKKGALPPKPKPALTARIVSRMIRLAMDEGSIQVAALMAVSRHFLLRIPSEAIHLQWQGAHSSVEVLDTSAKVVLTRRKNVSTPSVLERECCCATSGRRLCSVHWLLAMREGATTGGRVSSVSEAEFRSKLEDLAQRAGANGSARVGTHALRRGMAQDIIDAGGSLAVLLRALEVQCFSGLPARKSAAGSGSITSSDQCIRL
jgi:hypothetical protein